MSAKVGTITAPISTGNQSYTGIGFQPKLVLFFATRQTADGYAANMNLMFGAAASASSRFAVGTISDDNVAGSSTHQLRLLSSSHCVRIFDSGGTAKATADFVSFNSDGFTLNWTTAGVGEDVKIRYIAFGGITSASILRWAPSGSTGNQAVSGLGFQPDAVLNFGIKTNTDQSSGSAMHVGMMTALDENACSFREAPSVSPTSNARWHATGSGGGTSYGYLEMSGLTPPTALGKFTHTSMDADGFTVNWEVAADSGTWIYAVCIKGGSWATGADTQKTSSGTKATTGVGFYPEAVLLLGDMDIGASSVIQSPGDAKMTFGASDGTNHAVVNAHGVNAVTTTEENSRSVATVCISHMSEPSTTNAEASIASMDSDGFTLNWTTADATAREFIYLAFKGDLSTTPADNAPLPIGGWGAC